MVDVQSLYKPSSPQQPTVKRRRLRLSSVPLMDLRSTSLPGTSAECAEVQARFSLTGSPRRDPHLLIQHSPKSGICFEGSENSKGSSGIRVRYLTNMWEGQSRFPKLDECAHFHYEFVEFGSLQFALHDDSQEISKALANGDQDQEASFSIQVTSGTRAWVVRRTCENFLLLDEHLHRCVYDRKFSLLPELSKDLIEEADSQDAIRVLLTDYLDRFSSLAGNLINCGPVLNWLELDNRGNRLIVTDDSAINTPAVAAAYVIKRYSAQASDEISFEVGDMISVIDMPPSEESIWWRGKKGFEVGFFPCECVELIGDKVPHSISIPNAPTKPVLRKHGKLISFFRSFILSRPSRRKLKQRGILKERVFGCDLGEHLLNSGHEIPMVLTCCAEFIEEHGIVDGIYRLSGITSNIQKLRIAFDEDRVPNLKETAILQDIHCVASLLKMYFRELPNPLLTYQLYDKFVGAVQSGESLRLMNMRDIVQQLPPPHYRTLEYLVKHLAKVASHGTETGMTPKNVAIVWAPNLLRSKELEIGSVAALQVVGIQAIVTEFLIRYVDLIFNEKLPIFSTIGGADGTPKKSRPKSLAISTPTKLLSLEEARTRALNITVQSQPKYIEVGGGPANLPNKYHTVIDLAERKRSSAKLKKSPSGWKSFFSKGRSHSQSSKEKEKSTQKLSPSSLQSSFLVHPVKDFTESDLSVASGKQLRSVKSAESLVSSSTTLPRNLDVNEKNMFVSDGSSKSSALQVRFDLKQNSTTAAKASPHTHMRSVSHDSYFETCPEATKDSEVISLPPSVTCEKDLDRSSERLVMDDFEDVASDMNHIHIHYDNDVDFLSTGTDELVDSSEPNDDNSLWSQSEDIDGTSKSPKKHRRKPNESGHVKSKFSFKEKFKKAFTSPPASRKVYSSGSDLSDESSLKGSLKRTPPSLKEKLYLALSPESLRKRQDNLPLYSSQLNEPKSKKIVSPCHSPKTKQRKWNNVKEEGSRAADPFPDDPASSTNENNGPNGDENEASKTFGTYMTKVAVLGTEKTVIVEVHATQEIDDAKLFASPAIGPVLPEEEITSLMFSSHMDSSSFAGDIGSPSSVAATVSDKTLDKSMTNMSEILDDVFDESLLEQASQETDSHMNSTISTPMSLTRDLSESQDRDFVANNLADFSAEIMSSFHMMEEGHQLLYRSTTCVSEPDTPDRLLLSADDPWDISRNETAQQKMDKSSDYSAEISTSADVSPIAIDDLVISVESVVSSSDTGSGKPTSSPLDRPDSESSTISAVLSGDGGLNSADEREKNPFRYKILVDETDNENDGSLLDPCVTDSPEGFLKECKLEKEVKHSPAEGSSPFNLQDLATICESSCIFPKQVTALDNLNVSSQADGGETVPTSPCYISDGFLVPATLVDLDTKESDNLIATSITDSLHLLCHQELNVVDACQLERPSFCNGRLSPMDDSKRKFESEIGRDILHERKMKLELEKIQQEQKCERSSVIINPPESRVNPRFLPSPLEIRHHQHFFGKLSPQKENTDPKMLPVDFTFHDALKGVELRRCGKDAASTEETKRKSEPIGKTRSDSPVESKRHSEPYLGSHSSRSFRTETKTNIKELMSKFESSRLEVPFCTNKAGSRLRSGTSRSLETTPVTLENPLVYLQAVDTTSARHRDTGGTSSHQPVHDSLEHSISCGKPPTPPKANLSEIRENSGSKMEPLKSPYEKPASKGFDDDDGQVFPSSASCEDERTSETEDIFQEKFCDATDCGFQSSVESLSKDLTHQESHNTQNSNLNDAARRERIDRYKEERRAQLREKIRSESFKMDKEEKSEFLAKLKHKTVSPTETAEELSLYRRRSQPADSRGSLAFSDICQQVDADGDLQKQPVDIISPTSIVPTKELGKQVQSKDSRTPLSLKEVANDARYKHDDQSSIETLKKLPSDHSHSRQVFEEKSESFLRTNPGRRSLRTGSESEIFSKSPQLVAETHQPKSKSYLICSSSKQDAKEKSASKKQPQKPVSLPVRGKWDGSAEKKDFVTKTHKFGSQKMETSSEDAKVRGKASISPCRERMSRSFSDSQTERCQVQSPPHRIREVAALFEKECSGTKAKATSRSSVLTARTRFLSQNAVEGAEKDPLTKKPSQYLSAV